MTPDDNQLSGHARIGDPVRADGYSPITNPTWVWARITGRISAEHLRIVWNAARRLDAAHRQFEHLRNSLDLVADATPGSIEWRLRMFNTLGDAELAVIALSRALQLTVEMPNLFPSISVPLPRIVKRRAPAVSELRDKCEHLEDDALQRPLIEDEQLFAVFRAENLFAERQLVWKLDALGTDHSLRIDGEATTLMIEARDYLVKVARAGGVAAGEWHQAAEAPAR